MGSVVSGFKAMAVIEHTFQQVVPPDFTARHYEEDNTYQVYTLEGQDRHLYIENVPEYGSRWFVVSRKPPEVHGMDRFPPALSGPYDTLEGAAAAYKLSLASLT